jgi:Xaa-Pro aminopeptidase
VYVGGYTCDFSRVATLGPPSASQQQLHRDAVEVQQLLLEQIRPGARVADIARLGNGEMKRRGYAPRANGHGMGMLINEPPLISASDPTVLTPGLTVGVEQGPSEAAGMFRWEDLVQVTETGYDLFTTEPSTLVTIDF